MGGPGAPPRSANVAVKGTFNTISNNERFKGGQDSPDELTLFIRILFLFGGSRNHRSYIRHCKTNKTYIAQPLVAAIVGHSTLR